MGIQSLQRFIESNCPGACVPVDLLKIARSVTVRRRQPPFYYQNQRLCLVVDGECCLDRLYGGYFSDWVCGGQWNRMVQFLSVLIQTIQNNNIELAVFFNGGLEPQRMNEWVKNQLNDRKKINQVLKHVATKATPPPKVWWIPPVSLRTCLRMALRHLNVTVVCTMDDHHQEVIAFCRENNFHGLMAEDAEYAIFDPPRYFSSEQLKLTYKGSLETREFILDEVAKSLNLHPNRFCIFAALLGNYLLTEEDLISFHKVLHSENKNKQNSPDLLIKDVVDFVRSLPSIDNLDAIGTQVFGQNKHEKIQKFKHCVQYYLNGTKDGFLRYRPTMQGRRHEPGCYPTIKNLATISEQPKQQCSQTDSIGAHSGNETGKGITSPSSITSPDMEDPFPQPSSDTARFASETAESELSSLTAYNQATGSYNSSTAPQIIIDPPTTQGQAPNFQELCSGVQSQLEKPLENNTQTEEQTENGYDVIQESQTVGAENCAAPTTHINGGLLLSSSTSSSSNNSSPNRLSPEVAWSANAQQKEPGCDQNQELPKLPSVPPEVMRTASERHQKGLMSPYIYQLLSLGEIKIPVMFEEDIPRDLPSPVLLYRPLRQMVYAILFNLHHLQFMSRQKEKEGCPAEKIPDIIIKEWAWNKVKQFQSADHVVATPLGWAVPTVQRLWFGSSVNDKKRRMRAFLTCMRSGSPLMLNTSYVPQHLLVMCCILRYIMSDPERPILRKQELDAFLAQAVSPHLMNAQHTQNMQLPLITTRGIHLAAMFMQGVECALFANDACGAPIPWLMCCPWLFFDGKLFHHKLLKANGAKNLIEVCDGQISQVAKVERMRTAILDGLQVEFARPPPPILPRPAPPPPLPGFRGPPFVAAGSGLNIRGRGRGVIGRQRVIARGGQLEIAGVVVGSWGANYGQMPRTRNLSLPPQVTSVGGLRRYGGGQPSGLGHGYIPRRPPPLARIRRPGPMFTQLTKRKQTKKIKQIKEKEHSNDADDEKLIKNETTSDSHTMPENLLIPLDGAGDGPQLSAESTTKANTKPYTSAKEEKIQLPDTEKSSPISQINDNHPSVLLENQVHEDRAP